jgi:23S rRNA (uracil1939-C5)-methyltransferase
MASILVDTLSTKARRRRRSAGPGLTAHLAVKPGDRVSLSLGPLDDSGEATATLGGAPVSVAGGLPGEQVTAEIVKVFHERVAARVAEVATASPDRVVAPCPYYLQCTGCQLQHLSYAGQLVFKRDRLRAEFAKWPRLAGANLLPTLPSRQEFGYRNHARFTVQKRDEPSGTSKRGDAGFVNTATRRFVKVDRCLLMDGRINSALGAMQGKLQGMSQLSVRVGATDEDAGASGHSSSASGGPRGLLIQPKLDDPAIALDSGQTHYEVEALGRRFRVAGSSFFQVNVRQLENVVELLREGLRLTGTETVVDAYCGAGTFAVLLAPHARQVIGIEDSASAVEDARANAGGLSNVRFIEGRAEGALAHFEGAVDAVVLDPPRAGCHPAALDAVCRLRPGRVALVSCEPAAMARDLARLCDGPFILEVVHPVDMFPQTRHVEAVAFLAATP